MYTPMEFELKQILNAVQFRLVQADNTVFWCIKTVRNKQTKKKGGKHNSA